jgi:phospholipid/cholesterol/gamma-HCH transport system substrate-binding protein
MSDRWISIKVGAFVLGAAIATIVAYRFVDERSASGNGYRVSAVFDDVQGLVPKSRVVIAGIQVGQIETIRLDGGRARVDLLIYPGVDIHDDSTISKRMASILGEALLVIQPGSATRPKIGDGDQIQSQVSGMGTDEILASVGRTAASVERVASQMERTFGTDEGGEQMKSALKNLSEALEAINRTIRQNEEAVGHTVSVLEQTTEQAGPRIVRILDNIESVTKNVRTIVGENPDAMDSGGGQIKDTIASLNRSAHQLETVLGDVGAITNRAEKGEGTVGRLLKDEHLIDEVEGVAEGIGEVVEPIARLQTIVGLQSEYNFIANTFKNYFSLRIQPREDSYYLFELINDPRGLTEYSQTTVRRSPPADGEPAFYQETRVETKDAFRFSLMMAKRIHFATFRFGILESTGGVGVDIHLLHNALELSTDMFAVGEQTFPRLRVRLAYEIVSKLWIQGGVDDAINESSDFFLGMRLRFNDEDLKSILPFAGGLSAR